MTKTLKYNAETLTSIPFISWMKDPHALDWLKEYKARKLSERYPTVSIGMARTAVRRKCPHFIKVQKENVEAAEEQLYSLYETNPSVQPNFILYADGKIFLRDPEIYTMLKMLYS